MASPTSRANRGRVKPGPKMEDQRGLNRPRLVTPPYHQDVSRLELGELGRPAQRTREAYGTHAHIHSLLRVEPQMDDWNAKGSEVVVGKSGQGGTKKRCNAVGQSAASARDRRVARRRGHARARRSRSNSS